MSSKGTAKDEQNERTSEKGGLAGMLGLKHNWMGKCKVDSRDT